MGFPRRLDVGLVYESACGVNVVDADGNRYVDLAAGFGALLLGHSHPRIVASIRAQSEQLLMALGDLYPSTARLELEGRLLQFFGLKDHQVIWGQSGSDAITAALKTAVLATGRSSVVAFSGAYHGLGHAPLSLCGLREGYRKPFYEQLNPSVDFLPYPTNESVSHDVLSKLDDLLANKTIGAVVIEPILGRGGCVVPPEGFLSALARMTNAGGALFIADEIWTGLGRAGSVGYCQSLGITPDIICIGKGLGGGIPISACMGRTSMMKNWQRKPEVVHTATFSGAAFAAATAMTTLEVLESERIPERALSEGEKWLQSIREACLGLSVVADVRGRGFMIGIDFAGRAGMASTVMFELLSRGYIVSTGGGERDVLVLTPPLVIDEKHREPFVRALREILEQHS
jgi:4-aminobutyrate aminotransferase/(S)-3-amino-2-methylpropionate transaminase